MVSYATCLNEVRPRRPEQSFPPDCKQQSFTGVSMKSGLEGRNNKETIEFTMDPNKGLNEVRPRRPEQWFGDERAVPVLHCLNEVRPRRPEQWDIEKAMEELASMKSGLEGRNNCCIQHPMGRCK